MKDMIHSIIFACLFIGSQIAGILHYHDRGVIPVLIAAYGASVLIRKGKTIFAVSNVIAGAGHCACQTVYLLLWHIDNMEGQTLC